MPYFKIKIYKSTRRRQGNKIKIPKLFQSKKSLLSLLLLTITLGILCFFYALYFKSLYFVVRNVIMVGKKPDSTVNYGKLERMVMDRNIFKVNLKDIKEYMLNNYRELRDLKLLRSFPDTITAIMTLRRPVAQIHQELYYPVDSDGVILSGVKGFPDERLPIIRGIASDISNQVGTMTDSKQVKKALLLLKQLDASGILDEHTLIEIVVPSIKNVIFFLEDGLEVKIGCEDFASRLENLKKVLEDPRIRTSDIRYIDLRFKEPVIGPKWKR